MKKLYGLFFILFLVVELHPQELIGKHTLAEWRYIIDTTWGAGQTTAEKLQTFDAFWNTIDQKYAGFNGIVDNWQQLKSYRDTVALGVSRGRFAGIINYLVISLQDAHVYMLDNGIASTPLNSGVPLLYSAGCEFPSKNWGAASHFGAALTPLPDSTLLVYSSVPNHPLGLVPGDLILGYDGRLWKDLYKELFEVQFPLSFRNVSCSSQRATAHGWLATAGMNWHLFDTIDVVKYVTEDTLHLPTVLLSSPMPGIHATEQMPVDGVPFPDVANGRHVSWGYINGSKIGYIYVWGWRGIAGNDFLNAVNAFMSDSSSDGLIIDLRLNEGGLKIYQIGFKRLFNQNVETMRSLVRNNPLDHLSMTDYGDGGMYMIGSDAELYDRPIAVLCGPSTVSAGDQSVNILREHPMVRTFGFPTNGGFGSAEVISGIPSEWSTVYTYRVYYSPPDINNNLNHKSIPVDEEVWLTREGVANGQDDVVKSALEWINNLVYPHNIITNKSYYSPQEDTVRISTIIENPNSHQLTAKAYIYNLNDDLIDSTDLTKQVIIKDGEKWTGEVSAPQMENYFKVSVNVFDQSSIDNLIGPSAIKFTTAGPLTVDSIVSAALSNYRYTIKPYIRNNGTQTQIENITVKLFCTDPWVTQVYPEFRMCPNLAPGQILGLTQLFAVTYDSATFPGYFNFTFEISSGVITYWLDSVETVVTGIEEELSVPSVFSLEQNYPNPFNPTTTIKYSIPKLSFVTIKIYDVLGSEVATLVNEEKSVGTYELGWNAANLPSGVYFYRIQAGDAESSLPDGKTGSGQVFIETKKMVLLR